MENIIVSRIKEVLDERNWNYIFEEMVDCFLFGVRVPKPIKRLEYIINVENDNYTVIAKIPVEVDDDEKEQMESMMCFLHRANWGMKNGCFEFDPNDGEIRFKVHVDCKNVVPSKEMIENSIDCPAKMTALYGEGIVGIIYGGYSAEKAFEKTEGRFHFERHRMLEEIEKIEEEIEEMVLSTDDDILKESEKMPVLQKTEDKIYEEFPEWDIYQELRGGDDEIG